MRTTILALFVAGSAWGDQSRVDDLSWVEKRVEEWQPKPSERKFDQIGWAADIRAGLALAKKHNRPFFLFTHDGRMARGRC
jgi:hypothetical protein